MILHTVEDNVTLMKFLLDEYGVQSDVDVSDQVVESVYRMMVKKTDMSNTEIVQVLNESKGITDKGDRRINQLIEKYQR